MTRHGFDGRLLGSALLIVLMAAGCGETGILIAVTGPSVDTLEFQVGVEREGRYLLDSEASGDKVSVAGRNLRSNPYELLLREPSGEEDSLRVRVLVMGRRVDEGGSSEVTAIGLTEPAQSFIDGEVLRRAVRLIAIGEGATLSRPHGCFVAKVEEQRFELVPANNRDCDSAAADDEPADCDDEDAGTYPGAPELCDGKDNDCDGDFAAATGLCFGQAGEGGSCLQGQRTCEQPAGGPGACELADLPVEKALCEAFGACKLRADVRTCVDTIVGTN